MADDPAPPELPQTVTALPERHVVAGGGSLAFTLKTGDRARIIDPDPDMLTSPCDAIVGACGAVTGTTVALLPDDSVSASTRGSPCTVTPASARASSARGRKRSAMSRCTSRVSAELQTLGRWALELTSTSTAMSMSAAAST